MTSEAWMVELEMKRAVWKEREDIKTMVWHEKRSILAETILEYCEGQTAVILPIDRTETLIRLMRELNHNLDCHFDCFLRQDVFGFNTMDVELIKHPCGSGLLRFLDIRRHELDADTFMCSVKDKGLNGTDLKDWHIHLDNARATDSRDLWRSSTRSVIRHFLTLNYGRHFAFLTESDARTLFDTWNDDFYNKDVSMHHDDPFQIGRPDISTTNGWSCDFRPKSWGANPLAVYPFDYIDIEMYRVPGESSEDWILYTYSTNHNRDDEGLLAEYICSRRSEKK